MSKLKNTIYSNAYHFERELEKREDSRIRSTGIYSLTSLKLKILKRLNNIHLDKSANHDKEVIIGMSLAYELFSLEIDKEIFELKKDMNND